MNGVGQARSAVHRAGPARRPCVVAERRTRGAGYVAMMWLNGELLGVVFGANAAEAEQRVWVRWSLTPRALASTDDGGLT